MSKEYVRLNLLYAKQAFLYLLAGLFAMLSYSAQSFRINPDSVYLLWLFGFVASMVFGITNIMVPSYGNGKEFHRPVVITEIILLNLGTIVTFIGFNDYSHPYLADVGFIMLVFAVGIHLVDLSSSRVST